MLCLAKEYEQFVAFAFQDNEQQAAKAVLPSPPPAISLTKSSIRHVKLPTMLQFRRDEKGAETSVAHKYYQPAAYLRYLEQQLCSECLDPETYMARAVVKGMQEGVHYDWAYNLYISDDYQHKKEREKFCRRGASLLEFIRSTFNKKFAVYGAAYSYNNAIHKWKYKESDSLDKNIEALQTAADLANESHDSELVLSTMIRKLPREYKVDLIQYITAKKNKALTMRRALHIMHQTQRMQAALAD